MKQSATWGPDVHNLQCVGLLFNCNLFVLGGFVGSSLCPWCSCKTLISCALKWEGKSNVAMTVCLAHRGCILCGAYRHLNFHECVVWAPAHRNLLDLQNSYPTAWESIHVKCWQKRRETDPILCQNEYTASKCLCPWEPDMSIQASAFLSFSVRCGHRCLRNLWNCKYACGPGGGRANAKGCGLQAARTVQRHTKTI